MKIVLDEKTITRTRQGRSYEISVRLYEVSRNNGDPHWTVEVKRRTSVVFKRGDLPSLSRGRSQFNACVNGARRGEYDS